MGTTSKYINMKLIISLVCLLSVSLCVSAEETTTTRPRCEGFTCPNNAAEGGLFEYGDGCSSMYCDCSYGVPYLMHCQEADPPLFFDPAQEVCNWCYNMCDTCSEQCSVC